MRLHVPLGSVAALALLALGACVSRPRMCVGVNECPGASSCVAGRCQPDDGKIPAILESNDGGATVRRIVLAPVDVAWVRRGDVPGEAAAMPTVFSLGRDSDDAVLLARFALPLPKEARIVEAYVLLSRSSAVDVDPTPVALHASRISDPWVSATVSWALLPHVADVRTATTRVSPASPSLVRVDVRAIVERWMLHDPADHGIAVVAETTSATGMSFSFLPAFGSDDAPAALPGGASRLPPVAERAAVADVRAEPASPRLEVYVK